MPQAIKQSGGRRVELPIKTEGELRAVVKAAFGVTIPDVPCGRKSCTSTPWRAFRDAYFCASPVAVWKASRGFGGKSFLLSLLGLMKGLTVGADVNILGGSGEQSRRILEHMDRFWSSPGAQMWRANVLNGDPTRTEQRLKWDGHACTIKALMASQTSVRGPHPQVLLLDEIDEMDLQILDAAMGQPMSRGGIPQQTVMGSTAQYTDGTMAEMKRRASDNGWPWHEWCYRENMEPHGWLSERDIEIKRLMVSSAMWDAEYENQEPNPESRAIQRAAVEKMFNPELGKFRGAPHEYIEIEAPRPDGRYSTGADWAKDRDWTVIVTLRTDCSPCKLVAFERRGREPWPNMVDAFDRRCQRYKGRNAHDKTGVGNAVHDFLHVSAKGVVLVGMDRTNILRNYIAAIERGEFEAPMIEWMKAEHELASHADVFKADSSKHHLPDSICAAALAYHATQGGGWIA